MDISGLDISYLDINGLDISYLDKRSLDISGLDTGSGLERSCMVRVRVMITWHKNIQFNSIQKNFITNENCLTHSRVLTYITLF